MLRSRPAYALEIWHKMSELVRVGRNPDELAKEFELTAQTIRKWSRRPMAALKSERLFILASR